MAEKTQLESWKRMPEADLMRAINTGMIMDVAVLQVVAQYVGDRLGKILRKGSEVNPITLDNEIKQAFPGYYITKPGFDDPYDLLQWAQKISQEGPFSNEGSLFAEFMGLNERRRVAMQEDNPSIYIEKSKQIGDVWNGFEIAIFNHEYN